MASTEGYTAVSVDGRLARSVRTRTAIVDALRSLHHDGDLRPTAPRVAERAGVSVRTVWQHFEDLETLFIAAAARDLDLLADHVEPLDPAAPLPERVQAFADQRGRMFEQLGPVWRAGRLQEPFSAQIRAHRDRLVRMGREQVAEVFARELEQMPAAARRLRLDALHIVTTWATWESMRTDLGLDVETATRTVVHMLTGLLPAT